MIEDQPSGKRLATQLLKALERKDGQGASDVRTVGYQLAQAVLATPEPKPLVTRQMSLDGEADADVRVVFDDATGVAGRIQSRMKSRGVRTLVSSVSCPSLGANATIDEARATALSLLAACDEIDRLVSIQKREKKSL